MKDIYPTIIRKLKNKEHFSFVRYGDGEFALIFQNDPTFSHLKDKWGWSLVDMGPILKAICEKKPKYIFGVQNMAYRMWKEDIDGLLQGVDFVGSDIFHRRSESGTIQPFFNLIKDRPVVMVGPMYLRRCIIPFTNVEYVETSLYGSWNQVEKLISDIQACKLMNDKDVVILYSASIASKVLIDYFYDIYKDTITQIDTGSLFDPYCGINSRKYHNVVIERLSDQSSSSVNT